MNAAKEKTGPGRPRLEVDRSLLVKLAALHCTYEDVTPVLEMSKKTFITRLNESDMEAEGVDLDDREWTLRELWKQGQSIGRMRLRQNQLKLAKKNATIAIFLGKQYLGQRDVQDLEHSDTNDRQIEPENKVEFVFVPADGKEVT